MQIKDLIELNRTRKLAGLSQITEKKRKCLVCSRPFQSFGDRICPECAKTRKKITSTYCGRQLY